MAILLNLLVITDDYSRYPILYNTLFSREENFAKMGFEIFSREDIFANILSTRNYPRENIFPRK